MRHGTTSRRQRGRNNNGNNGGNNNGGRRNNQQRTQVYDSNGPDVRIRGTAHQVAEKYLTLAKDATSIGESVIAQNYFQHAEHYIRLINENNGKFEADKPLAASSPNDVNVNDGESSRNADQPQKAKPKEVEDLSLPKSILGPEIVIKKEKVEELEEALV